MDTQILWNSAMQRKRYSASFKALVALDALKELKTVAELSSEYKVHANQISQWKKQLKDGAQDVFSSKPSTKAKTEDALKARLYQQIGQLKVELDWLKKKTD